MPKVKRPLERTLLVGRLTFILLLCIVLSAAQSVRYRSVLYSNCERYMENMLRYVAGEIDVDDLAECMRTGEESEAYRRLQTTLDAIRDTTDIHFIYIVEPLNTEPTDNIRNVIAGVSREEYETLADQLVHLNMLTGDSYSPATAKKYLDAYRSGQLSFFEEISQWGDDYTGLLPLFDSAGRPVAALCVDMDVAELHQAMRRDIRSTVLIVLALGMIFDLLFYFWISRNVTNPLEELERSVTQFADSCQDQRDPEALVIRVPERRSGNEVEALTHAVTKMSRAMQDYVKSIALTESELARMAVLANKDALTGVRNKNAYDAYVIDLQAKMRAGAIRFAMLMVDLNELKRINDSYGHEKGDLYLQCCCRTICVIFAHSAVFRVGGDEFTVVMLGEDFDNRWALLEKAREEFRRRENDETLPPWERCSAAIGMAEYHEGRDSTVEEIVNRADKTMYREKKRMKV